MCLDVTPNDQHFYIGYAYEALARAEMVAGQREKMEGYLSKAKEHAAKVAEAEERGWLESDLETIQ